MWKMVARSVWEAYWTGSKWVGPVGRAVAIVESIVTAVMGHIPCHPPSFVGVENPS